MLPAERSRVNSRALHSPTGTVALGHWELLFRIPPASYGTHGEELWEANTNINQRDSHVPGPSLARTPANVMEPGKMGQVGHTWGWERATLAPAQHKATGAGPSCCPQPCSALAQHHLPPVQGQPTGTTGIRQQL